MPTALGHRGASYVALEVGQVFRRFGVEVTAVEAAPRLLGCADEDVAVDVRSVLETEGLRFEMDATAVRIEPEGDGVVVSLEDGRWILGSYLLIATGRQPNKDRLALPAAGVEVADRSYVQVDEHLRAHQLALRQLRYDGLQSTGRLRSRAPIDCGSLGVPQAQLYGVP